MQDRSRRVLLPLLSVLVGLALTAASCGPDGDDGDGTAGPGPTRTIYVPPGPSFTEPTPEVNDADIVTTLGEYVRTRLARLTGPGSVPLECPGELVHADVVASSPDARGCLWQDTAGLTWIKVQNLSRVPLNVYFRTTWWTIDPGAVKDYRLIDAVVGQQVRFQLDLTAAVASAVVEYAQERANPVLEWRDCANAISTGCLLSGLGKLLPPQVTVRGLRIPARRIVNVMNAVWTYEPLVRTYQRRASGTSNGTLVLKYR